MVTNVTNLSRNGLRDWLIQRVTSVVLGAWFVFISGYILCHSNLDYITWSNLFSYTPMRIFTFLALVSMVSHAWIGIWTVLTDYFTERFQGAAALPIRLGLQVVCALVLVVYLVWGVQVIWGL